LVAEKGTVKKRKERRIILFGKSEEHKQAWLKDLQYCLWGANGRKGPDPSKGGAAPHDVSYDSDDEPEPTPSHRKPTQPSPKEEPEDYDSGSSSDEKEDASHKGVSGGGDPLIVFDPFGDDASKGGHSSAGTSTDPFGIGGFNPSLHQGVDARGQAIPKGVMLPPLQSGGGAGSPYGSGGAPYDASAAYGGVPPYGYPAGTVPYGATGFNPVLAGATTAPYGSGGAFYAGGGVSPLGGSDSLDKSALYGAAYGAGGAVGNLFTTEVPKGGAGGAGTSGGAGVEASAVDLDAIAQKELLDATRAIELIAQELASRQRKVQGPAASPDAPLTWDHVCDGILDGTQAIARAATALLKATAAAQKERVESDIAGSRKSGAVYHADPVWANGLISAGRYVVASTQLLVSTANAAVQGQAKEEALVASSQAVAIATAQLVAAERAKGNIHGQAHAQLEDAAAGIKRATQQLLEAAKLQSQKQEEATPQTPEKYSLTDRRMAEIEAKTRILALEAETQRAREELARLRKEEYQGKGN